LQEKKDKLAWINPRWPCPSTRWVRQCERWLQLDARLPAILSGDATPTSAVERIELSELCYLKQRYHSSARFLAEAFTGSPALAQDPKSGNRYKAARMAGLAGRGQGKEAAKLDEKEQARWRKQALKWLEADLPLWTKPLESGKPQDRKTAA